MKQIRFLLMMSLMLLSAQAYAYNNDFLEEQEHYTVMDRGGGVIHFKIPVFSRSTHNYMLHTTSDKTKTPVILKPTDNRPYKIIENDHVIIIRNNERYDVTGKKLQ